MTTNVPPARLHHSAPPPHGAPPAPPRRSRPRRWIGITITAVVLAAVGIIVWDLAQPSDGTLDDDAPGGLVIEDTDAGVAYTVPDDWSRQENLIDAFSSGAASSGDEAGAAVYAFAAAPLTGEELSYTTSTVAGENSEFFYPYAEHRQILLSEPTTVDGHQAYRFTWEVSSPGQDPMYGHLLHVLTERRSVFVLGVATPADDDRRTRIDTILSSVALL